jgi:hypothetical protein
MKKLFTESKRLIVGLPLVLAVCVFIGCASTGGADSNVEPGTLTITGIPQEFEGKFFSSNFLYSIPDPNAQKPQGPKAIATSEHTAVMNGEVKMPIYNYKTFGKGGGYAGSDALDVMIEIYDKEDTLW